MKKLFKSKKGSIPIINEIVQIIMHSLPTPIKILLFLLLINLIGSFFIPTILGFFGYSCVENNGEILLYQVPMSKSIQNSFLQFQQGFFSLFKIEEYTLPDDPFPYGNKKYLKIPDGCIVQSKANTSNYGYSAGCVNCTPDITFFLQPIYISRQDMVCIDDGFATSDRPLSMPVSVAFCNKCTPPEPYYFNLTICKNSPFNDGVCYFTLRSNVAVEEVNAYLLKTSTHFKKIVELGGVRRMQNSSEIINIQCSDVNSPHLYFFNIKIFDLKMWVYLVISYSLIFFAYHWYKMIGL